ncbi:hypothetical protein NF27_CF00030 [Candidatus Jidaibacter acanthamoeba]|uniref:Uncharacterized protein n=1 Tax=Candidatus Jidaibacter acanthamoebae TaxID=86105 RepID=A0A0C1QKK6_9RICK|nr:hypothetical protein [Candidatus Jidaibacter acanthamoeba]KIE06019.1 hypothetical protein NF27_CF00030 [Candidatus Jidaibacter acanthamoeba]
MLISLTKDQLDLISGGMCNCLCNYQGNEYFLGKRKAEISCIVDCRSRGMGYISCN